jgi:hypothetical protein
MDLASAADAIEAVFDATGEDAVYGDGGTTGAPCLAIPWRPSRERQMAGVELAGFSIGERSLFVLVQKGEVPSPTQGMAFRLLDAGTTYRIGDTPVAHDTRGLVWRCPAVEEATT